MVSLRNLLPLADVSEGQSDTLLQEERQRNHRNDQCERCTGHVAPRSTVWIHG